MDLLSKSSESANNAIVLISQEPDIVAKLAILCMKVITTLDELSKSIVPRAILIDRTFATPGYK